MIKNHGKIISLGLMLVLLLVFGSIRAYEPVNAQSEEQKLNELNDKIKEYEAEIQKLKSEANTLSNQINQFDAQIRLTLLKIEQTNEKIQALGGRIDRLQVSMSALEKAFDERVIESYKMSRSTEPLFIMLSADNISDAISRYYYLQRLQEADRDLMQRLQEVQGSYIEEKADQEVLQKELEEQNKVLGSQRSAKDELLRVTKNDEKMYQNLLAQTKAEYEAIQAIIAGKGEETKVGPVSAGQRIASIIQGRSCNSNGTHLHFTVRKPGGVTDNPLNYLKPGVSHENNSGGDSFNPSGSWDWPISPPIKFNQGYGSNTSAISSRTVWYHFHDGLDINSLSSPEVRAVRSGNLYRGSYTGNGGCALRYVRVDHEDSDIDTLYLHVNY